MSYQVLARKWRPQTFTELAGQNHVLKALVNALDHDRLHHAYLFTGTRGVGKTTIARILAKCLNCDTGVSSSPCGQCDNCQSIVEGRFVDLMEIDAASRTGVDDMRELLDNVQYTPSRGRYKVYLIDEVHMLSNSAFNALLKTLEEPPPHVKFLLATTDPQKIPPTILSRCLQFNLKNMTPKGIVEHLQKILEHEMLPAEEPGLWMLARAAQGSMRDALSLTDQAIAFGAGKITEEGVREMLGALDQHLVYELFDALVSGEANHCLQVVDKLAERGVDFAAALDELMSLIHRVAIAQAAPAAVDDSLGDQERIQALAGQIPAEDLQLFYQMALNGSRDLPFAPEPRGGFEMCLLRMLAFKPAGVHELPPATGSEVPVNVKKSPPAESAGGAASSEFAAGSQAPVAQSQGPQTSTNPVQAARALLSESPQAGAEKRPLAEPEKSTPVAAEKPQQQAAAADGQTAPQSHERGAASEPPVAPAASAPAQEPPPWVIDDIPEQQGSARQSPAPTAAAPQATTRPAAPEPAITQAASVQQTTEPTPEPTAQAPQSAPVIDPGSLQQLTATHWCEVFEAFDLPGMLGSVVSHCELKGCDADNGRIELVLAQDHAALYNPRMLERLQESLSQAYGRPVEVALDIGATQQETPAAYRARKQAEALATATAALKQDEGLNLLMQQFDARLDENSIRLKSLH